MRHSLALPLCVLFASAGSLSANPPVAAYLFPAGGQRGTDVKLKVGGLFLHQSCRWEMLGVGVQASPLLKSIPTLWFEGSLLPLPDSQRQEDYPKDMAGSVKIANDAPLGVRHCRLWTSQGASPSLKFMIGDLPEIIEDEIDGDPIPVRVTPNVTINGRIFPRENVDLWSIQAKKGETFFCEIHAARLGSPLDARLDILDPRGMVLAENEGARGGDPALRFTAPSDGAYQVRVRDANFQGGQAYVYRLTITTAPVVDHLFPLGGKRGDKVKLALAGQGVPPSIEIAIPKDAASTWRHAEKLPTFSLDTDDLPERVSGDPGPVDAPVILNGRIAQPGAADAWTINVVKSQPLQFELRAGRLGSPLDGVVTILDAAGKTLARGDGEKPFTYAPTSDGPVSVNVRDRFRSRGGPAFAYRLRVAPPPAPDFRLAFPVDAVTVLRKGQSKMKINAERIGGFKEPIDIQVEGLPEGVKANPLKLAAGQNAGDLTLVADGAASIDARSVRIVGVAKDRKATATWAGAAEVDAILLAVALPTPFVIKGEYDMGFAPRGAVHQRKYKIERNGFDGPIEISLADRQARHLQGVTASAIMVPAGVSEFTYAAYLPPNMETGRTCRVCVMGVGIVREGDAEHRVAFSSVNQNEQLVAVVGPGQLALELEKTSGVAAPGKSLTIPVRVKRGLNLKGEVKVELIVPAHIRGVSAEPLTIGPDDEQGVLTIRFAARVDGPFNMPLMARATLMEAGRPVVAEALLDVQP